MAKIHVTDRDGQDHELEATKGWSVMEIVRENDLPIEAACGGCCACATCHVYVDEAWLSKLKTADDEEDRMLDEAYQVQENSQPQLPDHFFRRARRPENHPSTGVLGSAAATSSTLTSQVSVGASLLLGRMVRVVTGKRSSLPLI